MRKSSRKHKDHTEADRSEHHQFSDEDFYIDTGVSKEIDDTRSPSNRPHRKPDHHNDKKRLGHVGHKKDGIHIFSTAEAREESNLSSKRPHHDNPALHRDPSDGIHILPVTTGHKRNEEIKKDRNTKGKKKTHFPKSHATTKPLQVSGEGLDMSNRPAHADDHVSSRLQGHDADHHTATDSHPQQLHNEASVKNSHKQGSTASSGSAKTENESVFQRKYPTGKFTEGALKKRLEERREHRVHKQNQRKVFSTTTKAPKHQDPQHHVASSSVKEDAVRVHSQLAAAPAPKHATFGLYTNIQIACAVVGVISVFILIGIFIFASYLEKRKKMTKNQRKSRRSLIVQLEGDAPTTKLHESCGMLTTEGPFDPCNYIAIVPHAGDPRLYTEIPEVTTPEEIKKRRSSFYNLTPDDLGMFTTDDEADVTGYSSDDEGHSTAMTDVDVTEDMTWDDDMESC